jgi:hypothetical protein
MANKFRISSPGAKPQVCRPSVSQAQHSSQELCGVESEPRFIEGFGESRYPEVSQGEVPRFTDGFGESHYPEVSPVIILGNVGTIMFSFGNLVFTRSVIGIDVNVLPMFPKEAQASYGQTVHVAVVRDVSLQQMRKCRFLGIAIAQLDGKGSPSNNIFIYIYTFRGPGFDNPLPLQLCGQVSSEKGTWI